MDKHLMTAAEATKAIRSGKITSEQLVSACLDHIGTIEDRIGAWAYLDRDHAMKQARDADQAMGEGRTTGPLHGLPVGIKDIIDTRDMPTENGTVLHAGRQPTEDATVVALLREAGAIILGKTVTTELAVYAPAKTRNPHNIDHTPGGSSSGSAAAVAAHMLPLALGTQTNGSVIRPAAFCGVYGFKPTFGRISRHRVLQQSGILDQIGVFARTIEDVALITEQIMAYDDRDPFMRMQGRPLLLDALAKTPPATPRIAFVETPMWDQAEADTQKAFIGLTADLGNTAEAVVLPEIFNDVVDHHRIIMEADIAGSFTGEYKRGKDKLSATLVEMIERGQKIRAVDYNRAVRIRTALNKAFDRLFQQYDAIVTPAATGEAPVGLTSTGNPVFCTIWTLCGMPAITLPLLKGVNGLPLGVQLVGSVGDDARLLRTAKWLAETTTR